MSRSLAGARAPGAAVTALLAAAAASILAVLGFRWLPVPTTAFMIGERLAADAGAPLDQRHDWVPWARISRQAAVAVIAAEDQKFPLHDGFDFEPIEKAMADARARPAAARREHDQPAGGEEPVPVAGPELGAQGARGLVHRAGSSCCGRSSGSSRST